MHKAMANLAHVLHNNRVKFPKDFYQHGGDDVTRNPPIGELWIVRGENMSYISITIFFRN